MIWHLIAKETAHGNTEFDTLIQQLESKKEKSVAVFKRKADCIEAAAEAEKKIKSGTSTQTKVFYSLSMRRNGLLTMQSTIKKVLFD